MTRVVVYFLSLFAALHASGQEWQRRFGNPAHFNRGQTLKQLTSGSIFYAGSVDTSASNDVVVTKLSADGNILWVKTYGGAADEHPEFIRVTAKGTLHMVCSATNRSTTTSMPYLLEIDTNGVVVREEYRDPGPVNMVYRCSLGTTDGGFVVTGYQSQADRESNDALVVKYDREGEIEWERTWGTSKNDVGHMIVDAHDGGYIISGDAQEALTPHYDMFALKIREDGELAWEFVHNDLFNTGNQGLIATRDGNYLLSGEGSTQFSPAFDLVFAKLDPAGKLVWAKNLGKTGTDACFSIVEDSGRNIIMTGYSTSYGPVGAPYNVFLGKMDPMADSVMVRYFAYSSMAIGYEIIPALPGGYLIAATSLPYFEVIHAYDEGYTDVFYPSSIILSAASGSAPAETGFFPVPADDLLHFRNVGPCTVYNAMGQTVTSVKGSGRIDVSGWSPGVYTVVSAGSGTTAIIIE